MKKEDYYSLSRLQELSVPFKSRMPIAKPALLVLDMQDYFLSPDSHAFVPSSPKLIPLISEVIQTFKQNKLPVIFTRHLNSVADAGMMSIWWREIIQKDKKLSQINEKLDTSDSLILKKTQYDAFYNTSLQEVLQNLGVETVIVTGVMTNLCCETTARAAFIRGYRVLMPVDATATMNFELHAATTKNLSHGFAEPVTMQSILNLVGCDNA